jgi:parvulin-like peptidyl-prolyl isomerase
LDTDISLDPPARPGRPALAVVEPSAAEIPPALRRQLARHDLLLPLLRRQVVAAAVADVLLSDEERKQAQQAWGASHGIRSAEDLQNYLLQHELSEADILWQAELPARLQRHCREHFHHRAEQRYLARKNQLDQVIYSLLRVEDGALARELYLRVAEGEADFAELATTYAKGPERATRGVVGPVPLLQAHPSLAQLLRTSRTGQLHPPLRIDRWWLVVRLESLHSASFDEEMQQKMARELFDEWVEQEVAEQRRQGGGR